MPRLWPQMRVLAVVAALALAGCGSLAHYGTESGPPTRLDGSEPRVDGATIERVVTEDRRGLAYVQGYLLVPVDDVSRLCTAIDEGHCEPPSLVLENPHDDLRKRGAEVLESGCCAIGSWAPRPVVVRLWLRADGRAWVVA